MLVLGAMALLAPFLASLYREPRVTAVALLWTLGLALQAIAAFPEALLKRQVRFRALTLIDLGAMVTGALTAIVAGSLGARSVALVLQVVVWNAVRGVGAVAMAGWLPSRPERSRGRDPIIDRLMGYGTDFGLARGIYWLGRQLDRMVVGFVSGAAVARPV